MAEMNGQPRFITAEGFAKIRSEYEELFAVERPKLVETIAWAAANGDRSENGDYIYGRKKLRVPGGTKHGTVQRLRGEGPPALAGGKRGDIHYRFVIDVPLELTEEQQRAVDALSQTMNGNPRESLLRQAGGGA